MILNKIHHVDCIPFMADMTDKCVDLILTDIPYGECNQKSGGLRVLDKDYANTCDFDILYFTKELKRISKGSIYVFCGIEQISIIYRELAKDMSTRLCHWQKNNPSPMNGQHLWLSATENCCFAKHSNATFNEHCKPNVWGFPCGRSTTHLTEKPLELFTYLIKTSSKPNDVVFDPCIGSGTTAIACIDTDRQFIGCEQHTDVFSMCKNRVKTHQMISRDLFA